MQNDSPAKLTPKQATWLEHIRRCQASGEALSAYAARHELPRQGIYRWKRRLEAMGALPASDSRRARQALQDDKEAAPEARRHLHRLRFVTARVTPEEATHPSVRIHFPNGVVLEVGASAGGLLKTDLLRQLAALP